MKLSFEMRKEGFELVKPVHEQFRGLPARLAQLFGKSPEWHRSHGYAPQTVDPLSNGNLSPVDHFLRMADQYEAAMPGAGRQLTELVTVELSQWFTEESQPTTDRDDRRSLIKEFTEAFDALERADVSEQTLNELRVTDSELGDLACVLERARSKVRVALVEAKAQREMVN